MAKLNWLDRGLMQGPHVVLCLTEAEYLAAAKHVEMDEPSKWIDDESIGIVHHFTVPGKAPVCVVCLHPTRGRDDPLDVIATLIHESVHVFQRYRRYIADDPSDEFEAYSIETIAMRLVREYQRRTAKPVKTRKPARG